MGVDEKKKRAKEFQQQTDKAMSLELEGSDLFSTMPVLEEYQFECFRDPEDRPLLKGSKARILDRRNRFDVYVNMVCVGYLIANPEYVRQCLNLDGHPGKAVIAVIDHISVISATFTVTVKIKK